MIHVGTKPFLLNNSSLCNHYFYRQCQQKLTQRQKLMQESYKINRALAESCRRNIEEYKCMMDREYNEMKHVRMSRVLLCLEGQRNEGMPLLIFKPLLRNAALIVSIIIELYC